MLLLPVASSIASSTTTAALNYSRRRSEQGGASSILLVVSSLARPRANATNKSNNNKRRETFLLDVVVVVDVVPNLRLCFAYLLLSLSSPLGAQRDDDSPLPPPDMDTQPNKKQQRDRLKKTEPANANNKLIKLCIESWRARSGWLFLS